MTTCADVERLIVVECARAAIAPFEALIEHDCEAERECWCDVREAMVQEASRALNALMAALLELDSAIDNDRRIIAALEGRS